MRKPRGTDICTMAMCGHIRSVHSLGDDTTMCRFCNDDHVFRARRPKPRTKLRDLDPATRAAKRLGRAEAALDRARKALVAAAEALTRADAAARRLRALEARRRAEAQVEHAYCATCRECATCNLRPCAGGGAHAPGERRELLPRPCPKTRRSRRVDRMIDLED